MWIWLSKKVPYIQRVQLGRHNNNYVLKTSMSESIPRQSLCNYFDVWNILLLSTNHIQSNYIGNQASPLIFFHVHVHVHVLWHTTKTQWQRIHSSCYGFKKRKRGVQLGGGKREWEEGYGSHDMVVILEECVVVGKKQWEAARKRREEGSIEKQNAGINNFCKGGNFSFAN